uniref:Secreted protein n=1 Tax=Plectus sambesii TaxID=2011161 RepID=A0A914WXM0_9BILA
MAVSSSTRKLPSLSAALVFSLLVVLRAKVWALPSDNVNLRPRQQINAAVFGPTTRRRTRLGGIECMQMTARLIPPSAIGRYRSADGLSAIVGIGWADAAREEKTRAESVCVCQSVAIGAAPNGAPSKGVPRLPLEFQVAQTSVGACNGEWSARAFFSVRRQGLTDANRWTARRRRRSTAFGTRSAATLLRAPAAQIA